MKNEVALRPSYWASVSGGKDSLFMLNLILHNIEKYPLDGVVHFELDIDFPFIHNVIDYMESECKKTGIRYTCIDSPIVNSDIKDRLYYIAYITNYEQKDGYVVFADKEVEEVK